MKDIEDVKQLSDDELNKKLADALEYQPLHTAWVSNSFPCYTCNLNTAREAQAKAIELYPYEFVNALIRTTGHNEPIVIHYQWIAKLLQASPRQISEAAYITLIGDNK